MRFLIGCVLAASMLGLNCYDADCYATRTCPTSGSGTGGEGGGAEGGAQTCTDAGECTSGFCVDGYCCDVACEGICEACDLPSNSGVCAPHSAGSDVDDECVGAATCDGASGCVYAEHLWSKHFGGVGADHLRGVATDSQGNVIAVGTFEGSIDFGGSALTSAGGSDFFVAKFSATGSHVWSQRYGDGEAQEAFGSALAVAVDDSDNILLAGSFAGTLNFGGTNLVNADAGNDVFVAKLSSTGTHVWSKGFAVAGSSPFDGGFLSAIDCDQAGNVFLSGSVYDDVNFGGGVATVSNPPDAFLVKLSDTGSYVWSKVITGIGYQAGTSLARIGPADIVWTGVFANTINLGVGANLTANGTNDIFLARFNTSGVHMWSARFGNDDAKTWAIASNASADRIAFGGEFRTSIDFGGGNMIAAGDRDAFVAVFTGSGIHDWSKRVGSPPEDTITNVAFDSQHNIVATGTTMGSVDFDGGLLSSVGGRDVFAAKLDPTGAHVWSRIYNAADDQQLRGLAIAAGDSMVLGGSLAGSINLGGRELVSAGDFDAMLARFGP